MSTSFESMAARMFPDHAAPAAAPAPAAPAPQAAAQQPAAEASTQQELAESIYPEPKALPPEELPAAVKAFRDADPARRHYDDALVYKNSGIEAALSAYGVTGDQAAAEVRSWAGVLRDVGVDGTEATTLAAIAQADHTAEVRATWPEQALAAIKEEHGDNTRQALADAQRLIARDPRLHRFLHESGLGSHPRIVALAVAKAHAARRAGTLK